MLQRVRCGVVYGVAGVGKTALTKAFAETWSGPVVFRSARAATLRELLDDARRPFDPCEIASDAARLAELAARLDQHGALLVIDDLHVLPDEDRRTLLSTLVQRLDRGRLLATSRALVPRRADDPDRFELKLAGLELRAAHRLWLSLDELYGSAPGFRSVWDATRGNPLLVKRAHCGDLGSEDDPVADSLDGLDADARRVVAALAMAAVPIPMAALDSVAGRGAIKAAIGQLIAEVDRNGACTLHDLFREAAQRSLSQKEIAGGHAWLAEHAPIVCSDPVEVVRETVRHLVALERWEEACDRLVSESFELVRSGAASELLRLIDRIPPDRRSVQLSLIRARALARALDFRAAYDELERLTRIDGLESMLLLPLAQVGLLTGRLDVAERAAQRAVEASDPPALAHVALALVWSYRGQGENARDLMAEMEAHASDPIDRGTYAICRAFSAWLDDRQDLAEEAMRDTVARFREDPERRRSAVFANGIMAEVLARRGKFEEAESWAALCESGSGERIDPRLRIYLRALRASLRHEKGDRFGALDELEALRREFEAAGYVLAKLWVEGIMLRILYGLGRRRNADAIFDEAMAAAQEHGITIAERILREAKEEDPLQAIARAHWPPRPTRGHPVRDRVVRALRDPKVSAELPEAIGGPGYGLDRAIALLAREGIGALARAKREADRDGADPEVIDEIARSLDRITHSVIVDGQRHQLVGNGRSVSLVRRRAVRRILYELAARPNAVVSRDDLARALWTRGYDPLVHENALKSNISNLRKLIDDVSLSVECDDLGYRLVVPDRFLYLPDG
jgi:tetratricopeptide (TPR) repeat protein